MIFDPSLSNSLVELAARIRAEHDSAGAAIKRTIEHAIAAGELLLEAKAQLKHGQWMPWLKDHCGLSDRTARAYMRVAKNKDKLSENGNVADLSLRGAMDALTIHLPPDDDENSEWAAVMPVYEGARTAVLAAVDGIGLGSIENDLALAEAATKAIAEASNVDEPAALADRTQRLRAYIRQAEKGMEAAAVEIRFRMERRLGKILRWEEEIAQIQIPVHPLCDCFPWMSETELDALADSIKRNGLRSPITFYERAILDGKCRYIACKRAGVEPHGVEFEGDFEAAKAFVISKNVRRAHYTEDQRAVAAAMLTLSPGTMTHDAP
jgi:hypothetical protein